MEMLLALLLPAVLFLVLEWLWCWRPAASPVGAEPVARAGPGPAPYQGLFTLTFVQQRLRVLAAELERLDVDTSIYARAFRMRVVRAAYEDLLRDASQLAFESEISLELTMSLNPLREELDV